MDKITNLASKLGGNKSSSDQGGSGSGSSSQEDYVDKAVDSIEQKVSGGKIDPAKMRDKNEAATDAIRGKLEQATGHKVPEKISN